MVWLLESSKLKIEESRGGQQQRRLSCDVDPLWAGSLHFHIIPAWEAKMMFISVQGGPRAALKTMLPDHNGTASNK